MAAKKLYFGYLGHKTWVASTDLKLLTSLKVMVILERRNRLWTTLQGKWSQRDIPEESIHSGLCQYLTENLTP
jgi:hypothetical protein